MQYRLIASQYSYIICGVVPKLTVVPPAMSITRQWQSVGQYCTHSDLQSGWPPRRNGWGLSGPNSTIQDYHGRRYALLTVRGVSRASKPPGFAGFDGNKRLVVVFKLQPSSSSSSCSWWFSSFQASMEVFNGFPRVKSKCISCWGREMAERRTARASGQGTLLLPSARNAPGRGLGLGVPPSPSERPNNQFSCFQSVSPRFSTVIRCFSIIGTPIIDY
ncbi:hypothetical protein E3N88_10073 [Mikania micrantha]|uniref:Uncharacterized protein n=1 Tax=Mikania micrantha TaxID=192012 RepID=A0A5N6PBC6_9ASTR|nr:hypothetical protein E3N88_10073 [Mikania micrantha]